MGRSWPWWGGLVVPVGEDGASRTKRIEHDRPVVSLEQRNGLHHTGSNFM